MRQTPSGSAYEFRHTWWRVRTLVIIVVGIGVAIVAAAQVGASPPTPAHLYSAVVLYSAGTYHFEFHAFNQYGDPLSGVNYSVLVSNSTDAPNPIPLLSASGLTPANGTLELSLNLSDGTYEFVVLAGPQNNGFAPNSFWYRGPSQATLVLGPLPPGTVVPILAPITAAVDRQSGISGQSELQIFYPSVDGECSLGCPVYYAFANVTLGSEFAPLPASSMTPIGRLTSSLQAFPLTLRPNASTPFLNLQVEIFSPSGSLLATDTNCSAGSFSQYLLPASVSSDAFEYFSPELVLVVPLVAIVGAFSTYAGDRLSGVLESSLAQPITRRALASSRFWAATFALWVMIGAGILVSYTLIHLIVGYFVLPSYLLSLGLTAATVGAFFVGWVFLLSHLVRSVPVILSASFGLFLFFGLAWSALMTLLEGDFLRSQGSAAWAAFQIHLAFLNPLQYVALWQAVITNTTPAGFGAGQLGGGPGSYGVTPETLGLASVAWVAIPLLLLLWKVRRAD